MLNDERPAYISSGQAAQLLHIAKGTLLRAVRLGEIPVARRLPGGGLQFHPADVEAFGHALTADRSTAAVADADDDAQERTSAPESLPHSAAPARRMAEGIAPSQPRFPVARLPYQSVEISAADATSVIGDILALLADTLHVGATFLARSTDRGWHVEHLYDRVGMGITAQATLPFADLFGEPLRTGSLQSFAVDDVRSDARFLAYAPDVASGIGSYTGAAIRHPDGRLYGVVCTVHPRARVVGDGEVALLQLAGRIVMQALDADAMHERERAVRAELEASQEQLHRIYGAMACGVLAFRADGTVLEVNDAALAILGLDRDAVARGGVSGLRAMTTTAQGLALDSSQPALQAPDTRDGRSWRGRELMISRPDGEQRWIRVDTIPLFDADGELQQAVASFLDITDHRLADQQLQLGTERFRALLENALDLISIVDREGCYRYASPSYKTVLGYEPELLIGTPIFGSMEAADAARFRERWPVWLADPVPSRGAIRIRHADGSWVRVDGYMRAALDNPAVDGIIFNARVAGDTDKPLGR